MKRSPETRYAIIKEDGASTPQGSIYIPCRFELNVPLWTYETMLTQSQYNGLKRHIDSRKIMHDTMKSILSFTCVAKHKKKHI